MSRFEEDILSDMQNIVSSDKVTGMDYEAMYYYNFVRYMNHVDSYKVYNCIRTGRDDYEKILSLSEKYYDKLYVVFQEFDKRGWTVLSIKKVNKDMNLNPIDVLFNMCDSQGVEFEHGLSLKFDSDITFNPQGRYFLSEEQVNALRNHLYDTVIPEYVQEMTDTYHNISNWYRQRLRSESTTKYLNLVREEVIRNWKNVPNKRDLFEKLYHMNCPVSYWVVSINDKKWSVHVNTNPRTIDLEHVDEVEVSRKGNQSVCFILNGKVINTLDVKFFDGILEDFRTKKGEPKKSKPDMVIDGVEVKYGNPFGWHFHHVENPEMYIVTNLDNDVEGESITSTVSTEYVGTRQKWTREKLFETAKKYTYIDDFNKMDNSAYITCRNHGLIKEMTWLKYKTIRWNHELCIRKGREFNTISEFIKNCFGGYNYARKHGLVDVIFPKKMVV